MNLLSRNDHRSLHDLFAALYNLCLSLIVSSTRLVSLHQLPRSYSHPFHHLLDTVSVSMSPGCCIIFMRSMCSRRVHNKRNLLSYRWQILVLWSLPTVDIIVASLHSPHPQVVPDERKKIEKMNNAKIEWKSAQLIALERVVICSITVVKRKPLWPSYTARYFKMVASWSCREA